MKKVNKVITALLPPIFTVALVLPLTLSAKLSPNTAGEDTAIYSDGSSVKNYDQPDVVYNAASDDDDDEEEGVVIPDFVKLHYFNENGVAAEQKGKQFAFYIWKNGVDGIEISRFENTYYNPDGDKEDETNQVYSVNEEQTMMTLYIDFSKPLFAPYKGSSLMFIIKYEKIDASNQNWGGQSEDTQLSYKVFPPNDKNLTEVWAMNAAGTEITILNSYNKTQVHGIKKADFVDWKTIHCEVTNDTRKVNWKLYAFDETYYKVKPKKRADIEKNYLVKEGSASGSEFDISLKYDAHINVVYSLISHDPNTDVDPDMASLDKTTKVGFEDLYFTHKFHTYYENPFLDKDYDYFGAHYSPESTTFRVWSPVAANMTLLLYEDGTPTEYADAKHPGDDKYKGYHMSYKTGGVWEVTIQGNLKGKYYNVQVDNMNGTFVTMDPYATSSGVCGIRGYIYDKNSSEVTPAGWDSLPLAWDKEKNTTRPELDLDTPQDLAIYEVHVQDLTNHESWVSKKNNTRGTYNAFVESGTTLSDGVTTTGYDHLKELGVNAVQLTPVFDHDNDERYAAGKMKYNWGYNPLNYNVPEGGYSSDPFDGAVRVKEYRNLVLQMSKQRQGHSEDVPTRVIMDVVYNHVSSASASSFNKLMPRYYFRYARADHFWEYYDDDHVKHYSIVTKGSVWDGSGCSNEVATERPLMRKFIVDSLYMWAKDYKVKGFRFDLMGLIDFKTLQEAQKKLYTLDKDIYMYGEGWTSGGYHGEGSDVWYDENPIEKWKEEYPGRPESEYTDYNYGADKWHVYNKNSKKEVPNGVYLGSFNDTTRNQLRGGNDGHKWNGYTFPGRGLVQGDTSNMEQVAKGLWGADVNVKYYEENRAFHFEQTVNYASCHDNWTVRDQLFDTVAPENDPPDDQEDNNQRSYKLVRESILAHTLIFASNSPAFMQGGEELFRTKDLGFDPNNPPEEYKSLNIKPSDCAPIYGRWITHNSYNTPSYVNAFNWNSKKSFTIQYNDFVTSIDAASWKETGYTSINGITGIFADLIRLHIASDKKRTDNANSWDEAFEKAGLEDGKFGRTSMSSDPDHPENHNIVDNVWWENSGAYGMQINEVFVYFTLGGTGTVYGSQKMLQDPKWTRYSKSGLSSDPYASGDKVLISLNESACCTSYYAQGRR